jgi:hypothetical protein
MNDYWNDPPEYDELPECCGEYMNFDEQTCICTCLKCEREILPEKDQIPDVFLGELPDNNMRDFEWKRKF